MGLNEVTIKRNGIELTISVNPEVSLPEILETVEYALKALTFCFDGHIEIIKDEQ